MARGSIVIPRWVQIPVGVLLLVILLFCLAGSFFLVIRPPEKNPPFAIVIGSVMILVSLWGIEKSFRLIFGLRTHGGLMGPVSLRIVAIFFFVLPVIALVTGQLQKLGVVGYIQAISYVLVSFYSFRIARIRSTTKKVITRQETSLIQQLGIKQMPLPQDVINWVSKHFVAVEAEQALSMLETAVTHTGKPASPRLLRCAAVGSRGELGRLEQFIKELRVDWRDVIMGGEYEMKEGKLVQVYNFEYPINAQQGIQPDA